MADLVEHSSLETEHFGITVCRRGRRVELLLTGDLDLAGVGYLRRTMESELAERGARRLIIDLTELDFIDAAGIAGLTEGSRLAMRRGKHFGIRSPQPAVRRAIDITGALPELQLL